MIKKSDGSTASYYELPKGATQLQHLISHKNMNAQIGEIFRACYRYGEVEHSEMLRDARKMKYYAEAEIARLEALKVLPEEPAIKDFMTGFCSHGVKDWVECPHCGPRVTATNEKENK